MGDSYRYRVFFTPVLNQDQRTYADEVDVSDKILKTGIGSIKKTIDSSDYDIGVFVFSDLRLKALNLNGIFNDPMTDSRSMFTSTRDLCKVRIIFEKTSGEKNSDGTLLSDTVTETITFRGLINDEATRADLVDETIEFRVLSRDSVLRSTNISSGVVASNSLVSIAMYQILNTPKITAVLGIDPLNINPANDHIIDVGDVFDGKSVQEMLNQLLLSSNSVLLVNDDGDVIIRDRMEDTTKSVLNLFGRGDEHGRENIIDISEYNTGKQRQFTSVLVNGTQVQNADFAEAYGYREKRFDLEYITEEATQISIAQALVDEFKFPKIELQVRISNKLAKDVDLFDRVSVNYPLRVLPVEGGFLPVIGSTKIGDTNMPLPRQYGSISIAPRIAFKVIEVSENPSDFTSTLKLRQTGKSYDDGFFDSPNNAIIGFAVIGQSKIAGPSDEADTWNPSALGAARIGLTRVA